MSTTRKTLALFWHHAWRYPKNVLAILIALPLTVPLRSFVAPLIVSQVLDRISRGAFNPHDIWGSFGLWIILYALIVYITDIVMWRSVVINIWTLELKVVRDISNRIFNHLVSQSADFHADRFGGSLVSQANKLIGGYIRFADTTVFNLADLVLSIIFAFIILTPRIPLYALALSVLTAIYVVGSIFMAKRLQPVTTAEAQIQSKQTGNLSDAITNVMAIKSFAHHKQEAQRYYDTSEEVRAAGKKVIWAYVKRDTLMSFLTGTLTISSLLIAIVGASWFHIGLGTLFLVVSYTATLSQRLWDFNGVLRNYNRALGDSADMVGILNLEPKVKDPGVAQKPEITNGTIELKNVDFTHSEAGEPLFENLNLKINPGEKIGLVGHSGSGKTTLTRLLLRFSDVDSGEILIDGQNIAKITQDDLRSYIAYVPQEPLLFHRSIGENIGYGQAEATDAEIAEAARKAHATEFIDKLPNDYDTLVGERGVKLSGGQRQRIAIARAILKKAPILVLDEATSALDSESERLIQAALRDLMKDRTAIVIAHRLSTIQKMDRIVVLDNGKIIEQGSHEELLGHKGIYAQLWAHQSGGFLED